MVMHDPDVSTQGDEHVSPTSVIQRQFWVLHSQPKEAWEVERVMKG